MATFYVTSSALHIVCLVLINLCHHYNKIRITNSSNLFMFSLCQVWILLSQYLEKFPLEKKQHFSCLNYF